jgi:hypothetical protein
MRSTASYALRKCRIVCFTLSTGSHPSFVTSSRQESLQGSTALEVIQQHFLQGWRRLSLVSFVWQHSIFKCEINSKFIRDNAYRSCNSRLNESRMKMLLRSHVFLDQIKWKLDHRFYLTSIYYKQVGLLVIDYIEQLVTLIADKRAQEEHVSKNRWHSTV